MASNSKNKTYNLYFQLGGKTKHLTCPSDTVMPKGIKGLQNFVRHLAKNHDKNTPYSQNDIDRFKEYPSLIQRKLMRYGLINPADLEIPTLEETISMKLEDFKKIGLSKRTQLNFKTKTDPLLEYFGKDKKIDQITVADAKSLREWCERQRVNKRTHKRGHSSATMAKNVQIWKQVFQHQVDLGVLLRNPFEKVRSGSCLGEKSKRILISEEQILKVKNASKEMRNNENQRKMAEFDLVFSFAHKNGVRIFSELERMTWADLGVGEQGEDLNGLGFYFRVNENTKTGERFPPYWPETRALAEELRTMCLTTKPEELVFQKIRTRGSAGYYLRKCWEKAGIKAWPKPFVNLRSTCISTWRDRISTALSDRWFGNSERVRQQHYYQNDLRQILSESNEVIQNMSGENVEGPKKREKIFHSYQKMPLNDVLSTVEKLISNDIIEEDLDAIFLKQKRSWTANMKVLRMDYKITYRDYHSKKRRLTKGEHQLKAEVENLYYITKERKKQYREFRDIINFLENNYQQNYPQQESNL